MEIIKLSSSIKDYNLMQNNIYYREKKIYNLFKALIDINSVCSNCNMTFSSKILLYRHLKT